jgi:hypothetical protein
MIDLSKVTPPPPPKLAQDFSRLAFEQNNREIESYTRRVEIFLRTLKQSIQELQK